MYESKIISFGSYLPENIVTNDDLSKFIDTSDEWIYKRTGIKKRRISTGENTSDICFHTAQKILENSNISADEIDLIIVATTTPDYLTPSTACIVQGKIGAKNALAFDISAACSGFVYGLSIADKFIKSGVYKNAIVIGGEILSKFLNWNDRSSCVLFGDGSGGVLISRGNKSSIIAEDLHSDGQSYNALKAGAVPVTNPFVKNENNDFYLTMGGKEIFNFAIRSVPKSIRTLIEKSNISLEEIKYIVPHQANIRIVEMFAKKLKISMDKFYTNINEYGNTSSGSIPIALSQMVEKGVINEGDKIIITGFGAGLTWGSLLIEI